MSRKVAKNWNGYLKHCDHNKRKLHITREYICEHCKKPVQNLTALMYHKKLEHSKNNITLKL